MCCEVLWLRGLDAFEIFSLCNMSRIQQGVEGGGGEQMICITALELLLCFSSLLRFDLLPLNYCVGGVGGVVILTWMIILKSPSSSSPG